MSNVLEAARKEGKKSQRTFFGKDYSAAEMHCGTVYHFNNDPTKMFGFIKPDAIKSGEGATVFFHIDRQREFMCDGGDVPILTGWTGEPRKGDRVVYEADEGPKGPRVNFWAQQASYLAALEACANRPTYRFRQRAGRLPMSRLHEKPTYTLLWTGNDLSQLRKSYSKSTYNCCNEEHMARYFEVASIQNDTLVWEPCDDPR